MTLPAHLPSPFPQPPPHRSASPPPLLLLPLATPDCDIDHFFYGQCNAERQAVAGFRALCAGQANFPVFRVPPGNPGHVRRPGLPAQPVPESRPGHHGGAAGESSLPACVFAFAVGGRSLLPKIENSPPWIAVCRYYKDETYYAACKVEYQLLCNQSNSQLTYFIIL